ncbi:MAG: hypothetical protein II377_05525, partial [Clostridia bacterium]|nr:hypothetical protein [Clostridia bacterium]
MYVLIDDEWVFSQGGVKVEDYVITENGYLRSSEWLDTIYVRQDGVNYEYKIYHKNDVPEWMREQIHVLPPITSSGPIVCLDQTQA